MKTNAKKILTVVGLSALTFTGLLAAPHGSGGHGTDILHLFASATMTNEGIEPAATGTVDLGQNQQGNANIQRLTVSVNGLTADTTYDLFAAVGDNPLDEI